MYYVLEVGSEKTVAMTHEREIAEMIAQIAKNPCVIRLGDK